MSAHFENEMPVHEQVGKDAFAPHTGQVDESPKPQSLFPLSPKGIEETAEEEKADGSRRNRDRG